MRIADFSPVGNAGRDGTSAAVTRVSIDFEEVLDDMPAGAAAQGDGGEAGASAAGATWRTVGAHSSIIEASFRALVDGLEWAIRRCDSESCALPPPPPPGKQGEQAPGQQGVSL